MKALQKPVLALKIVKSFEIGNINQQDNRFDRLLSECAAATLILGSRDKTAIVQIDMNELCTTPKQYDGVLYGNIQGQILFMIDRFCKFSYLFHANLLFTDHGVYKLVQAQSTPVSIQIFETPLTALVRLSSEDFLAVDTDYMIRLFRYRPEQE